MSTTRSTEPSRKEPRRLTEYQRALAAAIRVEGDKRLGRKTPEWIVELAKKAD